MGVKEDQGRQGLVFQRELKKERFRANRKIANGRTCNGSRDYFQNVTVFIFLAREMADSEKSI
jgi:hypothetical protein